MTVPNLTLVTPETPAPTPPNKPSPADKITLAAYVVTLKARGFCKLDDASSNYTRLFNRFNGKPLPLSFIDNDFSRWLFVNKQKCSYRSPSYITYTLPHVVGTKFVPVDTEFFTEPQTECLYVNTYRKYTPTTDSASVSPLFLEYLERLAPDPAERHIFTQWLSHIFQYPQERPSWHVMLCSDVGTGKGFLVESILHPLLHHTSVVSSFSKVMGQFSTMLEDNLLVLLDDPAQGSDDTQTKLKSLLSEERAYTERKHQQGGMVRTYTRFMLASNDDRPLHLAENERRWYSPAPLIHRHDKEETQRFIKILADWLALPGSLCAVHNWFMSYSLEGFNPKHIDQSANLKSMIGMSADIHSQFLNNYISEHVVFTHSELMDAYDTEKMQRPNSRQVPHLLREAGYVNARPRIDGKLTSLCHPINMKLDEIRVAHKRQWEPAESHTTATPSAPF
ncbi:primase-helicase family protein [Janthinobacterium sp. PAMC25594]|uniref:primase-helicase family protein n=1 Tax=Janthinobacterium sp. PAMC25594 TaxID=2861284 RepID=UPI001C632582|nr:primase-helicase family protein [Janthinobacterium sp. PAMC25594]QYG06066.1 hypothetical protein KY494_22700 [Janthinobacterium sp. PAMC25594]